jgi:hypothetical protein
MVNV